MAASPSILLSLLVILLPILLGIAALVVGAVLLFRAMARRKKRSSELEKMKIQDLDS